MSFSKDNGECLCASMGRGWQGNKNEQRNSLPIYQSVLMYSHPFFPFSFHIFLGFQTGFLPIMVHTNLRWGHRYHPAFNLHCKTNISQIETAGKHWKGNDHSGNHKKHQSWRDLRGLTFLWLLT